MDGSAVLSVGCWSRWHSAEQPLRLGASSCLLGENVRFDGGHARDSFVDENLRQWFEFVPVCPEMEIGMGSPRPSVRLIDEGQGLHLVAPSTGEDFTERMQVYSERRIGELQALDLDGYVLKKSSPTCGMERIRAYRGEMPVRRTESGLFAAALMRRWPALPIEEEGRLNDAGLRENFIERVFCRNRWRALVGRGLTRRRLIEFHTAHKLLIRAHNETSYQRLGRLVGSAGTARDRDLYTAYEAEFQVAFRTKATTKRHANVLEHALGFLKAALDAVEKREILSAIGDYRRGLLPLIVPLTLLRYGIRRHEVTYLADQLYFDPHPKELMLRNHA